MNKRKLFAIPGGSKFTGRSGSHAADLRVWESAPLQKLNLLMPIVFLTVVAALTFLAGPVAAQEPTFDQVNAIAEKLNCPTCQGLNLADCNTQTCAQWRDQIKDMLAQGNTEQEILDWYAARYGDEVLQEPPRRGVGLVVWLLPVVALLAGGIWVVYILKTWSAKQTATVPAETPPPPQVDEADDYLQQVEQDLKNL